MYFVAAGDTCLEAYLNRNALASAFSNFSMLQRNIYWIDQGSGDTGQTDMYYSHRLSCKAVCALHESLEKLLLIA